MDLSGLSGEEKKKIRYLIRVGVPKSLIAQVIRQYRAGIPECPPLTDIEIKKLVKKLVRNYKKKNPR